MPRAPRGPRALPAGGPGFGVPMPPFQPSLHARPAFHAGPPRGAKARAPGSPGPRAAQETAPSWQRRPGRARGEANPGQLSAGRWAVRAGGAQPGAARRPWPASSAHSGAPRAAAAARGNKSFAGTWLGLPRGSPLPGSETPKLVQFPRGSASPPPAPPFPRGESGRNEDAVSAGSLRVWGGGPATVFPPPTQGRSPFH